MSGRPPSPLTDSQVISASRRDPARFAEIFDRHWPRICSWCVSRVGREAGEDIAAETFRVALDARGRFDLTHESAGPWLFGIASNLIAHDARSASRRSRALSRLRPREDPDIAEGSLDRVHARALSPELAGALDAIAPAFREALLLHVWAELSYEQIAEATGVPVGTVRSRIHRARATLRAALSPEPEAVG